MGTTKSGAGSVGSLSLNEVGKCTKMYERLRHNTWNIRESMRTQSHRSGPGRTDRQIYHTHGKCNWTKLFHISLFFLFAGENIAHLAFIRTVICRFLAFTILEEGVGIVVTGIVDMLFQFQAHICRWWSLKEHRIKRYSKLLILGWTDGTIVLFIFAESTAFYSSSLCWFLAVAFGVCVGFGVLDECACLCFLYARRCRVNFNLDKCGRLGFIDAERERERGGAALDMIVNYDWNGWISMDTVMFECVAHGGVEKRHELEMMKQFIHSLNFGFNVFSGIA